ncbi:hypothetical protein V6Z11_A11G068900 [Gossypium hirsutum]
MSLIMVADIYLFLPRLILKETTKKGGQGEITILVVEIDLDI